MDNQVDEALKARINERLKNTSVTDYAYVKVLLLYWEASGPGAAEENIAFQNEGRELGEFLSTHFQYAVEEYAIPFEFSQLSLQRRVAEEVIMASRSAQAGQKALLIIHYGGHGDEDEDPERRSVWAGSVPSRSDKSVCSSNCLRLEAQLPRRKANPWYSGTKYKRHWKTPSPISYYCSTAVSAPELAGRGREQVGSRFSLLQPNENRLRCLVRNPSHPRSYESSKAFYRRNKGSPYLTYMPTC